MKLIPTILLVLPFSFVSVADAKHLKGQSRHLKPKSSPRGHSRPSMAASKVVKAELSSPIITTPYPATPRHLHRELTSSYGYGDDYYGDDYYGGDDDYYGGGGGEGPPPEEDLPFFRHCSEVCEGNAVSDPSKFRDPTSVDDWNENKLNYCCDGGASFLKIVFKAQNNLTGMLTFDADIAAEYMSCPLVHDQFENSESGFGGTSAIRIIPCDEECVLSPIADGGNPVCSFSLEVVKVESGTEVCFAVVDPATNKVLYDEKMGTDVHVWFIPDDTDDDLLEATIHTSCSEPLVPPYAAALYDPCLNDSEDTLINIGEYSGNIPYLAYVDGISTHFYEGAVKAGAGEDEGSYAHEFDISMATCRCNCGGPTETDSPSVAITESPVVSPSGSPTESPISASPSRSPTGSPIAASPSRSPTESPTTASPSWSPTTAPTTASPSRSPTDSPSSIPSKVVETILPTLSTSAASPTNGPSSSPSVTFGGNPGPGNPTNPTSPSNGPSASPSVTFGGNPGPGSPGSPTSPSNGPSASPSVPFGGNPGPGSPGSPTSQSNGPSASPSVSFGGNPGPGSPGSPTGGGCVPSCIAYVATYCVFNDVIPELRGQSCDVTAIIPGGDDDDIPSSGGGGEDGRFLISKFDYHMSRIEAIEQLLLHLEG